MSWKILLVDDDDDHRDVVARLLEARGYRVATACDGAHALRQFAAGVGPSLVILDMSMPVMDGPTLLVELAGDPKLASTPVLVMSSWTEADIRDRLGDAQTVALRNVVGFAQKPVAIDRLFALVRAALHRDTPATASLPASARRASASDDSDS